MELALGRRVSLGVAGSLSDIWREKKAKSQASLFFFFYCRRLLGYVVFEKDIVYFKSRDTRLEEAHRHPAAKCQDHSRIPCLGLGQVMVSHGACSPHSTSRADWEWGGPNLVSTAAPTGACCPQSKS